MTTLADAYKDDLERKFLEQLALGETMDDGPDEALFELKGLLLKTRLKIALEELMSGLSAERAGNLNPEATAVSKNIITTVVQDVAMALTGKEWEPKE